VEKSANRLSSYLNDIAVSDNASIVQKVAIRLGSLQEFQHNYIERSVDQGWFLLFFWEYIHEQVEVKCPEKVGQPGTLSVSEVRGAHNSTFTMIVEAWKKSSNPDNMSKGMKVFLSVFG
jgi:hypothetical protein